MVVVSCSICNIIAVLWTILFYLILRSISCLFHKRLGYYLLACCEWIILWTIDYCSHWIIPSSILTYILKLLRLGNCIYYSNLGYWLSLIYYWHSLSIDSSATSSSWLTFSICILLYNLLLCLIQYYLLCIIFKEIYLRIRTCTTHIVNHIWRLRYVLWIW